MFFNEPLYGEFTELPHDSETTLKDLLAKVIKRIAKYVLCIMSDLGLH